MAGFSNEIMYALRALLTNTAPGNWITCDDGTDTFGYYNNHGTPEGVVTADIGSWCSDTTNGDIYIKKTGSGNTGWLIIATGGSIASLSPYIVGPTNSDFTDIPAAIAQAVADGASATDQKNIYVKPNNGTPYSAFTLPDGVNIIGFDWSNSFNTSSIDLSVSVQGPIVVSSGSSKIINVNIIQNNANAIELSGGNLSLTGVNFDLSGTSVAIAMTGTSNKVLNIVNCNAAGSGIATSSLFSSDGAVSTINISTQNFNDSLAAVSTLSGPDGTINWNSNADIHAGSFAANCSVFNGQHFNDSYSTALTAAFVTGASTTGQVRWAYCQFNGAPPLSCGNAALVPGFIDCYGTSFGANTYASGQQTEGGSWYAGTGVGMVMAAPKTGYRGSELIQNQAFVQTTDATQTTLFSIVLNQLESITLKGTITAAQSDHTNMVGGDFEICARRASGGNVTLVGSVIDNVNSSSAATFTCDVDTGTQTIRVRVTGVAATTYNWTSSYSYQKILNNT